jgi:hypothetical protein
MLNKLRACRGGFTLHRAASATDHVPWKPEYLKTFHLDTNISFRDCKDLCDKPLTKHILCTLMA